MILFTGAMPELDTTPVQAADPVNVEIRQTWSGMLPTASLKLFPENQRKLRVACITGPKPWKQFWSDFDADGALPKIDFKKDLVVIAKNVRYLNRINIRAARLDKGTLKVLALETRTARPIQDSVYCSVIVVRRTGIEKISDGGRDTVAISAVPALTGSVQVTATQASFENVTAWVRLWEYDPLLADASADLFGDARLTKLSHKSGTDTTIAFELGDKSKINPRRQYYVTVFLYRDGKVGDVKSEIFFLDGFNKVKLPGRIKGTLKKLDR